MTAYLPPDVAARLEGKSRVVAPNQLERITSRHWEVWFEQAEAPGPINGFVWRGIVRRGRHHIKLTTEELRQWAGKHRTNCGACKNGKMHGDPRRGFCATMAIAISMSNEVLCEGYR